MLKRKTTENDFEGRSAGAKRPRLRSSSPTTAGTSDEDEVQCDMDVEGISQTCRKIEYTPEEWEELEMSYIPQVEAQRNAQDHRQGAVAEYGIIEKIELFQFMCHRYLTVEFGNQINFIVGHNGSGKSAILAGIVVGLGGKAASTGRGNGLKSLIQSGKSKAEIIVTLKNQGYSSYRPEVYGDRIKVVRTITQSGSSTYKILSTAGNIISTRKAELDAICDHMNIQVENPVSILRQDAVQKFLRNSSPKLKYELFFRGTYLEQLEQQYETIKMHTRTIQDYLESKQDYRQVLEARFHDARKAFHDSLEAQDLRSRKERLTREYSWALANEKQTELEAAFELVASSERRLEKVEKKLETANKSHSDVSEFLRKTEEDHTIAKKSAETVWSERDATKRTLAEKKREMTRLRADEKTLNDDMTNLEGELIHLDQGIGQESQKLEDELQVQKEATRREIQEFIASIAALKEQRSVLSMESDRLQQDLTQAETANGNVKLQIRGLRKEEEDLVVKSRTYKSQIRDPLTQYGKNIAEVLEAIETKPWRGQRPIGPLGRFVKLNDPALWGATMRQYIGHLMRSYAVTDARDLKPLREILSRTNNQRCQIIVSAGELFDYSRGEPPPRYLTALRLLEISNEWVKRIFIDHARVECTYMARTRREAEDILKEVGDGVAWSSDEQKLTRWRIDGGNKSEALMHLKPQDPRSMLFRGDRCEHQLAKFNDNLADLRERLDGLLVAEKISEQEVGQARELLSACADQLPAIDRQVSNLQISIDGKRAEGQVDSPLTLTILEQDKQDRETAQDSLKDQFAHLCTSKEALRTAIMELQIRVDAMKADGEAADKRCEDILQEAQKEAVTRTKAEKQRTHWQDQKRAEQKKLDDFKEAAEAAETAFAALREEAASLGGTPGKPRPSQEVKKLLTDLNTTLIRYDASHHKSAAQLETDLKLAKATLHDWLVTYFQLKQLAEALSDSLDIRAEKWSKWLACCSVALKNNFMYLLSSRGYFGQVILDHGKRTLDLKIQIDDQAYQGSQGKRDETKKDPASLSGGEKSLATLCLLLSLWNVCGFSIRCLDEFDVCMDGYNRRFSLRTLVDASKSANSCQTIIITPLAIDNVFSEPPIVVIQQMHDPRG